MIPPYIEPTTNPDFHAVVSISIGELYHDGLIAWQPKDGAPDLDWSAYAYSPEQYERVCDMFVQRFWLREISIYPLKLWCQMVVENFREAMQKYTLLYKQLDNENIDVFQDFDNYEKTRHIYSDFPATQLSTKNQDYASSADDHERETIQEGSLIDKVEAFKNRWVSVDVALLDEVGKNIFSSLYTVNMNGF